MAVIKGDAGDNMLIGTRESDSLSGLGGNDRLYGLRGNDDLDGGFGADLMAGRVGDDVYWVDDPGDRVSELLDEGFFDQVRSSVSFTLPRNVEHLVLIGTADIDGRGNGLDNIVIGNEGANILNGRGGIDLLEGRAGNDLYVVDDLNQEVGSEGEGLDRVVEHAGEGVDAVLLNAGVNRYRLPDNIENLIIIRGSATGNALDNFIRGGDGYSSIGGGDGADRIAGREGNDVLSGNPGDDVLIGGNGNDTLTGGDGLDRVYGGRGNDFIHNADRIYFNVTPHPDNADEIEYFFRTTDRIYLDRTFYGGIADTGRLDADAFHVGNAAADAEDRIIFLQARGQLFYDADGTGPEAARLFATLQFGRPITHLEIFVYDG